MTDPSSTSFVSPPRPKRVLITGISGQDGSYLAEKLVERGDDVWGLVRKTPPIDSWIAPLLHSEEGGRSRVQLVVADLCDSQSIRGVINQVQPDEIYHFAAQSHVHLSYQQPEQTIETIGLGTLRLLEAALEYTPQTRFLLTSSSEIFGTDSAVPQNETIPLAPRNPYGIAKTFATHLVRYYREHHGMYTVNAICFNHESPRRGTSFVTRKITRQAARIHWGLEECLELGNLNSRRDWGFAGDYVDGMWRSLQADTAADYVFATGVTHSVRDFCDEVFRTIRMPLTWHGTGRDETGVDENGIVRVRVDSRFFREDEPHLFVGDASRAAQVLNWQPTTSFQQLVQMMVEADLARECPSNDVIPEGKESHQP